MDIFIHLNTHPLSLSELLGIDQQRSIMPRAHAHARLCVVGGS